MKKVLVSILCVILLAAFCSCAPSEGEKEGEKQTAVVTDENGVAVTDDKGNVVTEEVEKTGDSTEEYDPNDDGKWSRVY